MKRPVLYASALTLILTVGSLVETMGGVILVATRKNQDGLVSQEYGTEEKGPGIMTPGDVAMASVLCDHGYSCRLTLDVLLGPAGVEVHGFAYTPEAILQPTDPNMAIDLLILSGSSASADVAPPPTGIPLMMGEHVTLGDRTDRLGSIFMYTGTDSSDPNESSTPPATKYMKVLAPNHPILQGIPLDAQGRVKIFREAYPEEALHLPTGGKKNFEYRWCTQNATAAAAGVTVLGVLDGTDNRACFAVVDEGGALANGSVASARMVHMFTNENGSGGSRRVFLALTEWGRLLFVRAAKWAMGEELQPFKSLEIKQITAEAGQRVQLSWDGSASSNYRIQATEDFSEWQTVADDILGTNGVVSSTLDIAAAPRTLFLRVGAMP